MMIISVDSISMNSEDLWFNQATMITNTYPVTTIGCFAFEWLKKTIQATIIGVTSTGVFLKIQDHQIIFLTNQNHVGPVNVVLQNPVPVQFKNGDQFQVSFENQKIILSNINFQMELMIKRVWKTPPKPLGTISELDQTQRLTMAANQLSILKSNQGFAPLLLPILKNINPTNMERKWLENCFNLITDLKMALLHPDSHQTLQISKQLVGSGRGLTPSGDDLLMGLLFMWHRWFSHHTWIEDIGTELLTEFHANTTAVSSTLFQCALHGEADARIQEMSDVLMNSQITFDQQAIELSRWGNSSGADVFLGMMLAIQSFSKSREDNP